MTVFKHEMGKELHKRRLFWGFFTITKHLKRAATLFNKGATVDQRNWNRGRHSLSARTALVIDRDKGRALTDVLLPFFREVQYRYNLKDQLLCFSKTVVMMQCKISMGLNVKRG